MIATSAKRFARGAALVALMLLAVRAEARTRGGVTMPDHVRVYGKCLFLNGLALREVTIFGIDVYVAGLYLERRSSDPNDILRSQQIKILHIFFKRHVDRSDLINRARKKLDKILTPQQRRRFLPKIARLAGWIPSLHEGDTLTFTYLPKRGLQLQVDGALKGIIPGKRFARALFSLWLGPHPTSDKVKRGLCGLR